MSKDPDTADLGDLFEELEELETLVKSDQARDQVRETMRVAVEATAQARTFGRIVRGFDRGDLAEALLGSILFGIPMAVEGGTQEVASFVWQYPVFMLGSFLFSLAMVIGILYVADIQDVRIHNPILGVIPRRLVGVTGVAFLSAAVILTAWGRVNWATPGPALATVIVAFVPMSIGAALGDIIPGS